MVRTRTLAAGLIALLVPVASANAAITTTTDANQLVAAMGLPASGATFDAIAGTKPHGVSDAAFGGFPTEGTTFAIMTTGDAELADDANSAGNSGLSNGGAATRGDSPRDVSILKIPLTVPDGANCVSFEFRFLSEEYKEFVGSTKNDAFIAELDTSDWSAAGGAITAPHNFAFDPSGAVISVNSTGVANMTPEQAAGTTYDGATALLRASVTATPGPHTLYLSIFDQGDNVYDSAVFVDKIVALNVSGGCKSGVSEGAAPPPSAAPPPAPAPAPTPAPTPVAPPKPVGPTPTAFGPNGILTLPSNKKCVSRRKFRIRVKKPKNGLKIESAVVFVNKKRVKVLKGKRVSAPVDLRGLPKGRFTVKITVLLSNGRFISGTRKYRTCTGKKGAQKNRSPV